MQNAQKANTSHSGGKIKFLLKNNLKTNFQLMFPSKLVHLILPKFLIITQDFDAHSIRIKKELNSVE